MLFRQLANSIAVQPYLIPQIAYLKNRRLLLNVPRLLNYFQIIPPSLELHQHELSNLNLEATQVINECTLPFFFTIFYLIGDILFTFSLKVFQFSYLYSIYFLTTVWIVILQVSFFWSLLMQHLILSNRIKINVYCSLPSC